MFEFVQLLISIAAASLTGGIVASAFIYRFSRRCTQLEWAIGDLQSRASTFRGKEMAEKRWEKQKTLEEEFAKLPPMVAGTRKRYDNDPLGE